jgi:hypothetical protein
MDETDAVAWEEFAWARGGHFVPAGRKQSPKLYLPTGQWLVQFQTTPLAGTQATAVFVNKIGFHASFRKMGFFESIGQRFLHGLMPPEETEGILLTSQFSIECTHDHHGRDLLATDGLLDALTQHNIALTPSPPQGLSELQYDQHGILTDHHTMLAVTKTMRHLLDTLHTLGIAYPL